MREGNSERKLSPVYAVNILCCFLLIPVTFETGLRKLHVLPTKHLLRYSRGVRMFMSPNVRYICHRTEYLEYYNI